MTTTSDRHKELGRRIAERRAELGIASQQEAATIAGVHLNTWSNAERGIAVRPRSMHAIASALQWNPRVPATILRGADQPTEGRPMTDMKMTKGVLTIALPGLTAVRIDIHHKVIAIDHISGEMDGTGEYVVHDLRAGTYGDFHQLQPADHCNDDECAAGQHIANAIPDPWTSVFAER